MSKVCDSVAFEKIRRPRAPRGCRVIEKKSLTKVLATVNALRPYSEKQKMFKELFRRQE